MQAYDAARFDPPAPLAIVTVRSEQRGIVIQNVPMLLDTGSDVSLLPRSHVTALIAPGAEQCEIQSFDGTKSTAPVIDAEILFLAKSFRGQFLLFDGWHGILGRNILNNLSLRFDGPAQRWMEER
jgi:predicted aspartyl protease